MFYLKLHQTYTKNSDLVQGGSKENIFRVNFRSESKLGVELYYPFAGSLIEKRKRTVRTEECGGKYGFPSFSIEKIF